MNINIKTSIFLINEYGIGCRYYQKIFRLLINYTANRKCENYAVFKLTAEGPLGPSSTSKVKA